MQNIANLCFFWDNETVIENSMVCGNLIEPDFLEDFAENMYIYNENVTGYLSNENFKVEDVNFKFKDIKLMYQEPIFEIETKDDSSYYTEYFLEEWINNIINQIKKKYTKEELTKMLFDKCSKCKYCSICKTNRFTDCVLIKHEERK